VNADPLAHADQRPDALEILTQFLYIVPVGLLQFHLDGLVDLANPLVAQLLMPLNPSGNLSDAYSALAPLVPDLARQVREFHEPAGIVIDHQRCIITTDGGYTVLALTVHRIHGTLHMAVLEDVTRLDRQTQQLQQDQERFRAIFANVREYAIYTVNLDGIIDEWNQSLARFGGWRAADVAGQPLDIFFAPGDRDRQLPASLLARARQSGSVETEGWSLRRDGSRFWANSVITILPDGASALRGFVVVSRDMTERKRVEDELRRFATTDPLTGAFNRRHGESSLADALGGAMAAELRPGVLLLDIDHFKSINDRHTHEAGDRALCALVDECRRTLGEAQPIIRWGEEEFLVLLPSTSFEQAKATAEHLCDAVRQISVRTRNDVIRMTISIGGAISRGESIESLIRRADEALYAAKHGGRDRVVMAM
jgi:diguanylate cyclase (GGDEF)-like protein/PAS domain S-box-containing protein